MTGIEVVRVPLVEPELTRFPSGATRSRDMAGQCEVRYDLITPHGLRRLAHRYAVGAKIHGDRNWEKGLEPGDTLNRVYAHLNAWQRGDVSDDHLAAAAWGLFALLHWEETTDGASRGSGGAGAVPGAGVVGGSSAETDGR